MVNVGAECTNPLIAGFPLPFVRADSGLVLQVDKADNDDDGDDDGDDDDNDDDDDDDDQEIPVAAKRVTDSVESLLSLLGTAPAPAPGQTQTQESKRRTV